MPDIWLNALSRHAPVLAVVIPLFAAALLAALTKAISEAVARAITLVTIVAVGGFDWYLLQASQADTIVYWFGNWHAFHNVTLGIAFAVDPIGAGLAGLASALTLAAVVFSAQYFDNAENHFLALMVVFLAALQGFALTGDLFNLFVFFELMSAAAFALCAHKIEDPGSLQGALNFAVTNTIGAYFVITGLALLYARTGALNMAQIGVNLARGQADKLVLVGFTFLVCGYLVKTAVVPFHFWLADAHAVAPTPICILFSGVMVEMGLYAVVRIYWTIFEPVLVPHIDHLRILITGLGAATAIVGAVMCYCQRSLKRLLAFSTISHMGILTMGFGLFTPMALAGIAVYVLGHGFVKSALFLTAGILLHRFESVDEGELHGKGTATRWTGIVFFLGALGLAGLPFSGIAAGDALLHSSAAETGFAWASWVATFAGITTAAAALRVGGRIFLGWGRPAEKDNGQQKNEEQPETQGGHNHTPAGMLGAAIALVACGLFVGLYPGLLPGAFHAASLFTDSQAYAARVLRNAPLAVFSTGSMPAMEDTKAVLAVLTAIVIALLHLHSQAARKAARALDGPIGLLRALHSGHIGDHVTFLTVGFGLFGAAVLVLL